MELTLEERERHAYITGDTEKAKLLAELIDKKDPEGRSAYNQGYDDGWVAATEWHDD